MVVRPDLDRPVGRVDHLEGCRDQVGIAGDAALGRDDLAGDHGIGRCRVTSLVPSGKVASTWIDSIISGTPSITSSRLSTWRPISISSITGRPSLAASRTKDVSKATASG